MRSTEASRRSTQRQPCGVVIVAAPGIHLTAIDIGLQPSTFAVVAARVVSATSSCIVAVLYRPGSSTLTAAFYTEFG